MGLTEELQAVTSDILDRMQEAGWFFGASVLVSHSRPTAWHINCGWCEEWAQLASERVGGEPGDVTEWGYRGHAHVVLKHEGRFYDSQHPEGVENLQQLDLIRGVTFEQWQRSQT